MCRHSPSATHRQRVGADVWLVAVVDVTVPMPTGPGQKVASSHRAGVMVDDARHTLAPFRSWMAAHIDQFTRPGSRLTQPVPAP